MSASHGPGEAAEMLRFAKELHPPVRWAWGLASGAVGIGAAAAVIGALTLPGSTWTFFFALFAFWSGVSQSCIVIAAAIHASAARWGRRVQRIAEAGGAGTLLLPFVFPILWMGHARVFAWTTEVHRSPWLNGGEMFLRDELILVLMGALSGVWLYHSVSQDRKDERSRPSRELRERGRTSSAAADRGLVERAHQRSVNPPGDRSAAILRNLAPFIIAAYCTGYAVLGIDLTMTVDSGFRSTMLPGIYWAGEFAASLGLLAILLALGRRLWPRPVRTESRGNAPAQLSLVGAPQLLDLGNLIWGFAIFRTWFDWSQYIIIWYGNIPDESQYLAVRWRTGPWEQLAYLSLGLLFVAPFVLGFSRRLKRSAVGCALLGALVFLGQYLRVQLDVLPSALRWRPGLPFLSLALFAGFAGLFALPYLWLLSRAPLYPCGDRDFLASLVDEAGAA